MLIKDVNEAYSQQRASLNSPKLAVRAILLEELNINFSNVNGWVTSTNFTS